MHSPDCLLLMPLQTTSRANDLPLCMQAFLAMPFEHSENLEHQNTAVELLRDAVRKAKAVGCSDQVLKALQGFLDFAAAHQGVIAKWGRFPHRNAVLGRESTQEEQEGMEAGTIAKFG